MNKKDWIFVSLFLVLLFISAAVYFSVGEIIDSNIKEVAFFIALISAGLLGVWIYTKGRIWSDIMEFLTTGKIKFKGFGNGKFKNQHLRQEKVLIVKVNNDLWTCPSCHENNKALQDICSNCGQGVEKENE